MTPLPPDAPGRHSLHNEVHARPTVHISLPSLVTSVALLNEGVTREQEWAHLQHLSGQQDLPLSSLSGNFLRLSCGACTVQWERHAEFTRYAIVQTLPTTAALGTRQPDLLANLAVDSSWLSTLPGQTIAAIQLAMDHGDLTATQDTLALAHRWLGTEQTVASVMGNNGHSWAVTDFRLRESGFEHMLVIATSDTSEARAGRIAQRLLEIETYRLMALRGLPVAKALAPELTQSEHTLAAVTAQLDSKLASDQQLLDRLIAMAASVENATAEHMFRFSATNAYNTLVSQRITELREKPISGTQTIGEFMQRRLSPAMATVAVAAQRLTSLSERIARTSALLRTRVDIATESQNQQLLEKLTKGQSLQLRLQSTVEGLSIAAISYYVVSLLLYGGKALKAAGVPLNPEMAAGALVPVVLWVVWRTTQRIHRTLHAED